jgi:hypothetical protein
MSTGARDELAETSRRLLQTLDELAGPEEVRIEDTGVEWRVLDKNDADAPDSASDESGEMRYDDSTLLPDDFGLDSVANYSPADLTRRTTDQREPLIAESNDLQGELLLSEPEDWTDLLDEVRDEDSDIESLEVEEELAAIHSQLSTREEPKAGPADLDSQFDTQAEAMGIDVRSEQDALTDEVPLLNQSDLESLAGSDDDVIGYENEAEDFEADEATIPDDEDTALSGDFVLDEPGGSAQGDSGEKPEIENDDNDIDLDSDDNHADSSVSAREEEDDIDDYVDLDDDVEQEAPLASAQDEDDGSDDYVDLDAVNDDSLADALDEDEDEAMFSGRESTGEFESQIDVAARALSGGEDEEQLADDKDEIEGSTSLALEDELTESGDSAQIEHFVPPPTEEEMTVNMEIDQEMMALATQDDEFSATLFGVENPEDLFNENSADVETIIMEGEFVRGSVEKERLAAEQAAKGQFDDPGSLVDTYALRKGKVRGGRRRHDPASYGITIAVVLLALALVGQVVHSSRESLATMGFFNRTIAPVYRMLGSPVTPAWNIKGWQFEATTGNVDDAETVLTVVTRIVNRSGQPLPYPLIHVSLTDRWEEVMGSRILEPGEYLAGDLDPSSPVLAGENFTAVITIDNPSAESTGFKLNVCYRVSPENVRCAIEAFKD